MGGYQSHIAGAAHHLTAHPLTGGGEPPSRVNRPWGGSGQAQRGDTARPRGQEEGGAARWAQVTCVLVLFHVRRVRLSPESIGQRTARALPPEPAATWLGGGVPAEGPACEEEAAPAATRATPAPRLLLCCPRTEGGLTRRL